MPDGDGSTALWGGSSARLRPSGLEVEPDGFVVPVKAVPGVTGVTLSGGVMCAGETENG